MRMAWVDLKHEDGEAMDFTAMEKPIMRRSETILFFFSFFFSPRFQNPSWMSAELIFQKAFPEYAPNILLIEH